MNHCCVGAKHMSQFIHMLTQAEKVTHGLQTLPHNTQVEDSLGLKKWTLTFERRASKKISHISKLTLEGILFAKNQLVGKGSLLRCTHSALNQHIVHT